MRGQVREMIEGGNKIRSRCERPQARARRWIRMGMLAGAIMALGGGVCSGLTFVYTTSGTVPQNVLDGFVAAGDRWSANFTNNVTVRITIAYSPLGANVIGSTSSNRSTFNYSLARSALVSAAVSADDLSSTGALAGTSSAFPVYMNGTTTNPNGSGSLTPWLDNDGDGNNTRIQMTRANGKALGLINATSQTADAVMTFSSDFSFDFNPRDGISGSTLDFVGVATHEIGHALGFIAGVDVLDDNANFSTQPDSSFTNVTPLDLFRFSSDSIANGTGVIDFAADTRPKYFSVDGGVTSIAGFSTGVTHGDGNQASHFKDGQGLGIMDPTFSFGELGLIRENDRRAFDVIGWTRDNTWEWSYQPGGSFQNALNWNADGVPGVAQDAVFALGQVYGAAVTSSSNIAVRDLIVRNDTLVLSPGTALQTVTVSRSFNVGDTSGATASLTLTQGVFSTTTTQIGTTAGSAGTFNFTGGTWTNMGSVAVGGTTNVAGGIGVLNRASTGIFNVTGVLKVWGAGVVNASNGSSTIATLDVASGGQVNLLSGTLTMTSTANAGTITQSGGNLVLGTVTGTGNLSIASAATARSIRQTMVTIPAGGALSIMANGTSSSVSVISVLSISNDGAGIGAATYLSSFDLKDNDLVLRSVSEAEARDMVRGWWNGGLRNGMGLMSSLSTLTSGATTTLGVVANSGLGLTTFDSVSVGSTDVLVKYTYIGDTNLDGLVDTTDLDRVIQGIRLGLTGWVNGDTNYDGVVNAMDYQNVVLGIRYQGAPLGDPAAFPTGVIPEPACLWAGLLGFGMMGQRRKAIQGLLLRPM